MAELKETTTSAPASLKVVVVERLGNLKDLQIKQFKEEELYKRAGFKSPNHFALHHVFEVNAGGATAFQISVYGKNAGIAGQENKYEFPPPIDNTLFFGNCILVKRVQSVPVNLTVKEWEAIYEQLYGGFENLDDTKEEDEAEEAEHDLEEIERIKQETGRSVISFTKQGYAMDDFVVDDGDDEEDDEEYVEEEKPKSKSKTKSKTTPKPKPKTKLRSGGSGGEKGESEVNNSGVKKSGGNKKTTKKTAATAAVATTEADAENAASAPPSVKESMPSTASPNLKELDALEDELYFQCGDELKEEGYE